MDLPFTDKLFKHLMCLWTTFRQVCSAVGIQILKSVSFQTNIKIWFLDLLIFVATCAGTREPNSSKSAGSPEVSPASCSSSKRVARASILRVLVTRQEESNPCGIPLWQYARSARYYSFKKDPRKVLATATFQALFLSMYSLVQRPNSISGYYTFWIRVQTASVPCCHFKEKSEWQMSGVKRSHIHGKMWGQETEASKAYLRHF